MNAPLTFNQAMFSLADGWLLYWFYWLGYSIVLTPLILAFSKATRRDALIVALTNIAAVFAMWRWPSPWLSTTWMSCATCSPRAW